MLFVFADTLADQPFKLVYKNANSFDNSNFTGKKVVSCGEHVLYVKPNF